MREDMVAVLGGGPGAHAYAGQLALNGVKVNLCELPQFSNAEEIKRTFKTSEIDLTGAVQGTAKLNMATTDIGKAIKNVKAIFVIARSNAHSLFAEACAPYLEDGQIIITIPGSAGSLVFTNVLKEKQIKKDVLMAEAYSLGLGTRFSNPLRVDGPNHVRIFFLAHSFGAGIGVFPAKRTNEVIDYLKKLYPETIAAKNALEAGLSNSNPMGHCPITVLNIGRIENAEHWVFHHDGISPSVIRVVIAMGKERRDIFKVLGWKDLRPTPDSAENYLYKRYQGGEPKEGLEEVWALDAKKGPLADPTQSRYLTEDIPFGLVLYSSLAKMVGVKTPIMDSLIELASVICQVDFKAEGRTVEKLGISHMSPKQLNDFLYSGKK